MKYPLRLNDFHKDWTRLVAKAATSYDELTPEERIWYNVQGLIGEVNNGGIISYYNNPGADRLWETMADLKTIDAGYIIEILSKANALFPDGIPPSDSKERNKAISSWNNTTTPRLLEKLDTEFYKQCPTLEDTLVEHILANNLTMMDGVVAKKTLS